MATATATATAGGGGGGTLLKKSTICSPKGILPQSSLKSKKGGHHHLLTI